MDTSTQQILIKKPDIIQSPSDKEKPALRLNEFPADQSEREKTEEGKGKFINALHNLLDTTEINIDNLKYSSEDIENF